MYKEKNEIKIETLENEMKVVGINLQKSGMPISFDSIVKMWNKKEVYTEEIQNNTKNAKHPVVEFGISLNKVPDYVVGREVSEFGEQDERYFLYTIPTGKYVKYTFNAETFDQMLGKMDHEKVHLWAKENNITVNDLFVAEVYPHETTMMQYPEMYLLFPINS